MENENLIAARYASRDSATIKSRLLFAVALVMTAMAAGCATEKPERTSFQTDHPWNAWANLPADVAMAYGIDKSLPDRLATWRDHGYVPYVMTGVAWGNYQDYLYGRFDGVNHEDEAQTQKNGEKIGHGGDVYYMSPGPAYGKYLCVGVKRAIDAGAKAVVLEEPEFWVRAGWSEGFKREWKKFYGEDWVPPDSSPEAQYRASKLKYFLYRRTLAEVFAFVKDYSKSIGRDVKCYVATHSMINYSHWGIVSPESSLIDVGCDGYIAQVWTGTAQTPEFYEGMNRTRTFETAFLEYGQMQNLVRASGRTMWYLNDPVADDPHSPWRYYRRNWECTLVASLLQPEVWRYEVAPWPERVFHGKYPHDWRGGRNGEGQPIPPDYAVELQATMRAMEDLKQPKWSWENAGTQGVGVLVSDTMMFQRFGPDASDGDLSSFFGLSMPLVARGIPAEAVQMENAVGIKSLNHRSSDSLDGPHPGLPIPWGYQGRGINSDFLSRYRMLLLTYEGQKPPTPAVNVAIAKWVKDGGGLIVVDDDRDPYNHVSEWWNTGGRHYASPREHLFDLLDLPKDSEGMHMVGKGCVYYSHQSPAELAHQFTGGEEVRKICAEMAKAIGVEWSESPAFVMRRGPYVVAAGLEESAGGEPVELHGHFVSLLDGSLPVMDNVKIEPGRRYFLVDADRYKRAVVAASARVVDEKENPSGLSFSFWGVEGTQARMLVRCEKSVKNVSVEGNALSSDHWRQEGQWVWVDCPNSAKPVKVNIRY